MFVTVPDGDVFRGLGCCKRFCIHFESTRRADAKERFKKKKRKETRSVGGREEGEGRKGRNELETRGRKGRNGLETRVRKVSTREG